MRTFFLASALLIGAASTAMASCENWCGTSSGNLVIGNSGFVSSTVSCCGDSSPSFSTVHKWEVKSPGVIELSGTSFAIKFDAAADDYELSHAGKVVEHGPDLDTLKRKGVNRASDLQDAGVSLK